MIAISKIDLSGRTFGTVINTLYSALLLEGKENAPFLSETTVSVCKGMRPVESRKITATPATGAQCEDMIRPEILTTSCDSFEFACPPPLATRRAANTGAAIKTTHPTRATIPRLIIALSLPHPTSYPQLKLTSRVPGAPSYAQHRGPHGQVFVCGVVKRRVGKIESPPHEPFASRERGPAEAPGFSPVIRASKKDGALAPATIDQPQGRSKIALYQGTALAVPHSPLRRSVPCCRRLEWSRPGPPARGLCVLGWSQTQRPIDRRI